MASLPGGGMAAVLRRSITYGQGLEDPDLGSFAALTLASRA